MQRNRFLIIACVFLTMAMLATACDLLPAGEEPQPVPPLVTEPPPPSAYDSLAALTGAEVPARDLVDLAERLGQKENVPRVARTGPAGVETGDTAPFWYKNHDADETEQIDARLVYQSEQLNLWVQVGEDVDGDKLQEAVSVLEAQILPTNRAFFGTEWQPGVDGDPRFNVLHLRDIGENVVGYFSAADEFVTAVNPFSNQREMLYISLAYAPIGSETYYEVIAHEMQHMIHWHTDSNEFAWINEGMSVLASRLNGFTETGYDTAFATRPDLQLTNFNYEQAASAHYGASYLFASYFLDRFGEEATQTLVRHDENGIPGVQATLNELGLGLTFDALFADWVVANLLDGPGRGTGIYQYSDLDLPEMAPSATVDAFPAGETAAVHQYGADYVHLQGDAPVTVTFTGTQQTKLLDTAPHSGDFFWSTLPADSSDVTLTGRVDLSGLDGATLTFWTWYDIEENWDYAYVTVSADGGETWHLLETEAMTRENPQGNGYGPALTGISGDGDAPAWIQQSADLTPYAGGPVLLRFEYVTDDTVHHQGWALDDIAIPELDFGDDVESGTGMWTPAGFVRHSNILPQSFIVQRILFGKDSVQIDPLPLDENQRGRWQFPLDKSNGEAILIISGNTPLTPQLASYEYHVVSGE